MVRKVPATKLSAVALFAVAIVSSISYRHWLATRTFIALEMPVSLSRGHIRSGDFYINLREQYFVRLNLDEDLVNEPGCSPYRSESLLVTHLMVFRNGQLVGQKDGRFEHYLGGFFDSIAYFDADEPGRYRLDIEVRSDASCLNDDHPQISVVTVSDTYHQFHYVELVFSGLLVLASFGLWNSSAVTLTARRIIYGERLVIFESANSQAHRQARLPLARPFSKLPPFGLIYAIVGSLVLIIVLIPISITPHSEGIWISVRSSPSPTLAISPIPPLVLRVRTGSNSRLLLYLNSKPVMPKDLHAALLKQFSGRPDWFVYVEASSDLSWENVAQLIDTIRQAHGTAVLLPKVITSCSQGSRATQSVLLN